MGKPARAGRPHSRAVAWHLWLARGTAASLMAALAAMAALLLLRSGRHGSASGGGAASVASALEGHAVLMAKSHKMGTFHSMCVADVVRRQTAAQAVFLAVVREWRHAALESRARRQGALPPVPHGHRARRPTLQDSASTAADIAEHLAGHGGALLAPHNAPSLLIHAHYPLTQLCTSPGSDGGVHCSPPDRPCDASGAPTLSLDGCSLAPPLPPAGAVATVQMVRDPWDTVTSAYWYHVQEPTPEPFWQDQTVEHMLGSRAWRSGLGVPRAALTALGLSPQQLRLPYHQLLRSLPDEWGVQLEFWMSAPGGSGGGCCASPGAPGDTLHCSLGGGQLRAFAFAHPCCCRFVRRGAAVPPAAAAVRCSAGAVRGRHAGL